jgi:hypothetical protein
MVTGSFEMQVKKNLLLINFALTELANRSDQAVDIGDFAPERDFASTLSA